MKILILSDLLNNWALHNRAKAIKKFLPEHEIDIKAALGRDDWIYGSDKYDLIHFNFSYGLTDFKHFFDENMKRCVITVVNERSLLAGHGVDVKVFEELLRECPSVTSVSKKIADMIPGIRYIPNGIDEDLFKRHHRPVVGFAGVVDKPNKNVSLIEKACAEMGFEFRTVSYLRSCMGEADSGQIPHEKMQDFYSDIDVYVHASLTEGFNNTILEALACNVPVLMTRQGCWQEFEGWVDFFDPTLEDLKKKLQKFKGRQLVFEKFLWKNLVPQYREVYDAAFARTHKV